jgi:hypothetical protein
LSNCPIIQESIAWQGQIKPYFNYRNIMKHKKEQKYKENAIKSGLPILA